MNRKLYPAILRIRFTTGLQYRAAALGGLVTQFFWGALELLIYAALYRSGGEQPMTYPQLSSYIWLQQAFLAMLMQWFLDADIFACIESGELAYELCRPADLYAQWFARTAAGRLSAAALRCAPILAVAAFLPAPYGLMLPPSAGAFAAFLLSLALSWLVVTAVCMLIYVACCRTVSPRGVRLAAASVIGFLAGEIVPIPFFPPFLRDAVSLLPVGAMQNMPLRIYSGNIAGAEALTGILLQAGWLAALALIGRRLLNRVLRRVQLQGG